jgi:hypothetical protein
LPAIIVAKPVEVENELEKIGLSGGQVLEIVHAMAGARADATENDPPGAVCRIHKSLRVTPAQEANLTDRVWSFDDLIAKMDEMAPPPAKRGPYKKRTVKLDKSAQSALKAGN